MMKIYIQSSSLGFGRWVVAFKFSSSARAWWKFKINIFLLFRKDDVERKIEALKFRNHRKNTQKNI